MKKVTVYTDGACSGNPGPGGYAAVLIYGEAEKKIYGGEKNTTNNRMELRGPIEALKMLKEPCEVYIHSDSSYVVNSFVEKWIYGWEKKNWMNGDKPRLNSDLLKELLSLTRIHNVTWCKVKGHADDEYNNICDSLAVKYRLMVEEGTAPKADGSPVEV